jgi:hypothetical protein
MTITCSIRVTLGCAAVVVLSACAGGASGSPALPMTTSATNAAHVRKPAQTSGVVLAVSKTNNAIEVFPAGSSASTPTTEITKGVEDPMAIATDKNGNLYVGNLANNTITEYANGSATPSTTIKGVINAQGIAIDADGNLWVSQLPSQDAYFAVVDEYAYNAQTKTFAAKPTKTISGDGPTALISPHGLAFDSAGDLFIADPSQAANIFEVAAGSTTVKLVPLPEFPLGGSYAAPVEGPYDVKIAGSGSKETFYVSDYLSANQGVIGGTIVGFSKNGTLTYSAGGGGGSDPSTWGYLAINAQGELFSEGTGEVGLTEFAPPLGSTHIIPGSFLGVATAAQW